jgi:hypothetical protein
MTMRDGLILRMSHYFDPLTLLTALGVMPAAQPA